MNIVEERYIASRTLGSLLRFIAYLVMITGGGILFFGIINIVNLEGFTFLVMGLAVFIGGIMILMSGELMRILIDIEENTRRASYSSVMALPDNKWALFGVESDMFVKTTIASDGATAKEEVIAKPALKGHTFCPQCKSDFVEGVGTCPDCAIDLIPKGTVK